MAHYSSMGRPFDRSGADDPDAGRGVYLRDPGNKIKVHNVNYHRSESDAEFVASTVETEIVASFYGCTEPEFSA
jgi:hypothetical protein